MLKKLKAWPVVTAFALASVAVVAGAAPAAAYPDKPITVVVHTKPGGGTDTMARAVWKHAARLSGAEFVIQTHSGAGGQIGYTKLATSKPDGYTLGAITTLSITTHELTRKGVVYKLKESFQPIGRVVLDPSIVVVRADSPFKTLGDLIAAAKKDPGKLTWGGTFLYGAHHVHYIMFNKATGAEMQYVPFDGGADSRAALLGGHIDVGSGGFSEYAALTKEGKLRVLVIGATDRWTDFPDVPTYKDLGFDVQIGSNRGFAVPAGTAPDQVKFLSDTIGKVVKDPEFLAEAAKVGIAPTLAHLDSPSFTTYLHGLQDTMREMLKNKK
jgi:tripartite-type tricarboxylate transporter receptor subunit TctC